MMLIAVQDFRCAYCCKPFLLKGSRHNPRSPTIEHVRPRRKGHTKVNNALAVHRSCNKAKGDREPTGCELLVLETINAKRTLGCVGVLTSDYRMAAK